MNVLVTGGAGYIGSHVCRDLLAAGHDVVIVDDLSRGRAWTIDRLRELAGNASRVAFYKCDVCGETALARAFEARPVDGVIHCAGVAYVSESIADPAKYDRINTGGTRAMLRACERFGVPRFLFSSSCTTYGDPGAAALPVREECPQRPMNPYGWSKLIAEKAVIDAQANRVASARPLHAAILRYFNVAGCDRAGILGHDFDPETRVIPLCIMAALGKPGAAPFRVFGDDYATQKTYMKPLPLMGQQAVNSFGASPSHYYALP